MLARILKIIELVILFIGVPLLYIFDYLPPQVILILIPIMLWCLFVLLRDKSFDRKRLWNAAKLKSNIKPILIRFAFGAVILAVFVLIFKPSLIFNLIRQRAFIWLMIMILYPVLSVYPQELIYRTFFFHRYKDIFPNKTVMIIVNAIAFGYMHIIFENPIAVILTLIGGYLFATTYDKTHSTLAASLEHALFGDLIFTIGLGWYFYHGAVK